MASQRASKRTAMVSNWSILGSLALFAVETCSSAAPDASSSPHRRNETMLRLSGPLANLGNLREKPLLPGPLDIRQERRQQPDQWQERAHPIHGFDTRPISELPQRRRPQPSQTEREAEEHPRHHAD